MKIKKSILALIIVLAASVGAIVGASAASGLQTVTAYLNSRITITLDGEAQVLKDANGVRIYPITYNDSTYLPVRAVAGLAGLDVNWDQATQTVQLGKSKGVDLIDTYKNYHADYGIIDGGGWQYQTGDKDPKEISGVSCSHWVEINRGAFSGSKNTTMGISFNLAGKHDNLTFSYYADGDLTLQVLGDNGSVLFEKDIPGGQVAQTITIPLLKTSQLTFQIKNVDYGGGATAYIFNAYLDAE